ncbi:MAG: helix-turn-helix domain-containing protein [bacterium]
MDEELIGTTDAAEILGVAPTTVARYVRHGRLEPAETLPYGRGVHRFRRRDVQALADQLHPDPPRLKAAGIREALEALEHEQRLYWSQWKHRDFGDLLEWLAEYARRLEAGEDIDMPLFPHEDPLSTVEERESTK